MPISASIRRRSGSSATAIETVLNVFDEYRDRSGIATQREAERRFDRNDRVDDAGNGKEIVRKALAMGADDAVMITDPGLAGSDVWATAYALAHAHRKTGFDSF